MALIFCNEFCEINKSNTQNYIECKNNYFPFPEGISNCFDDKEEELNTKEEGSIKLETKSYYSDKEILTSIKEEHKTNIKEIKTRILEIDSSISKPQTSSKKIEYILSNREITILRKNEESDVSSSEIKITETNSLNPENYIYNIKAPIIKLEISEEKEENISLELDQENGFSILEELSNIVDEELSILNENDFLLEKDFLKSKLNHSSSIIDSSTSEMEFSFSKMEDNSFQILKILNQKLRILRQQ